MRENENVKTADTRWKASLIRANNGWILEYWEEIEDNEWRKVERVFEDRDGMDIQTKIAIFRQKEIKGIFRIIPKHYINQYE